MERHPGRNGKTGAFGRYTDYTRQRIRRVAEKLEGLIYPGHTDPERLEVAGPVDRIPYSEAKNLNYRPVELGEEFGPVWSTFWFNLAFEVPRDWAGHRVDLHNLLYDEVGTSSVHLGRRAVGVEPRGAGATISFADGSSASADVVIGADGIHSMVREALWGPESPRFSGSAVWRGLVPATSVTHLDLPVVSCATLGPDRHFVHYYVAAGRLVNWVAVAPTETWTLESWTAPAHLNDALEDYEGWNPTVRGLMTAVGDAPVYRWALYDRDPLPRWGEGPVTLLGDACHPMLPYMAQGAAQAIEDAGAWCLETHRVKFARTFFSLDRTRMICLYQAPDAEAVRMAQRQAGMPMERVWACTQVRELV